LPFDLFVTSSIRYLLIAALVSLCATASASVQTCNTRCQTAQTDCNLRCDGNIPCINQCQVSADGCADACLKQ
jgi:hypothetical protein